MDSPPSRSSVATGRLRLTVGSDPWGAGQARAFARNTLADWGLGSLSDDVALVVSELVGNSLRHGLPPVTVTVWQVAGRVSVNVTDEGTRSSLPGVPSMAEIEMESGRGLAIVAAVAGSLDIAAAGDAGGLSVTASFPTA